MVFNHQKFFLSLLALSSFSAFTHTTDLHAASASNGPVQVEVAEAIEAAKKVEEKKKLEELQRQAKLEAEKQQAEYEAYIKQHAPRSSISAPSGGAEEAPGARAEAAPNANAAKPANAAAAPRVKALPRPAMPPEFQRTPIPENATKEERERIIEQDVERNLAYQAELGKFQRAMRAYKNQGK